MTNPGKNLAGQGCPAYGLSILFPPNPFCQWRSKDLLYIFPSFFSATQVACSFRGTTCNTKCKKPESTYARFWYENGGGNPIPPPT